DSGSRMAAVGPQSVRIFDVTAAPRGEIYALDISPHQAATGGLDAAGNRLAVFGFHGRCPEQYMEGFVIDLATGEVIHRFYDQGGHTLALSPDGRSLIHQQSLPDDPDVAWSEKTVESIVVKDMLNGGARELDGLYPYLGDPELPWPSECEDPLRGPYCEFILDRSVTPDARLLAAGGYSGAFSVWNLETGGLVITQDLDPECCVWGVALNHSGSMVAATARGFSSSRMVVFDINGEILYEQPGLGGRTMFTADGKYLVTDLPTGQVRVFDVDDWSWWELDVHQGPMNELDVSPSGRLVVTVGGDSFVKVIDIESQSIVHEIDLGDDFAKAAAFVDDDHIAIGTQKGLVAVLTTDSEELAEIARSRLTRTLTDQECQTYLHLESCPDPTVGR
ncbi:MAG TPA: WD40 repeat domain-containing protein, partial [Acidimicrobiia bacterium]|nr:WD40 repeat domain-containing protein [Acidimicrobiia bacterium]